MRVKFRVFVIKFLEIISVFFFSRNFAIVIFRQNVVNFMYDKPNFVNIRNNLTSEIYRFIPVLTAYFTSLETLVRCVNLCNCVFYILSNINNIIFAVHEELNPIRLGGGALLPPKLIAGSK